jgi:hypothetical protein
MESEDFVKFAFNVSEKLKGNWWSISFDERKGVNKFYSTANFISIILQMGSILTKWWSWRVLPPRPPVDGLVDYRLSLFAGFFSICSVNKQNEQILQLLGLAAVQSMQSRASR